MAIMNKNEIKGKRKYHFSLYELVYFKKKGDYKSIAIFL